MIDTGKTDERLFRVVIVYDDPRGGTWRGPLETYEKARARLIDEAKRARGSVRLEQVL